MTESRTILINTPALTRVEGEGALDLCIKNGAIESLQLRIFEPPRYFEKFLEQRAYTEVLDIVARICGICPVAYQMSSAQALEQALDVMITPWVQKMRRALYCGEWLQSHALHIHLLALPDFVGCKNALEMGQKYPDILERGFLLQGIGNELIKMLGGRSVHPVGAKVGGFYHAPGEKDIEQISEKLKAAIPQTVALINWLVELKLPDIRQEFIAVSLKHPDEYPMIADRIISSDGLDISLNEFDEHFAETHVPHSTALHAHYHGTPYLVGPLARLNLQMQKLPKATLKIIRNLPVKFPSENMYHSMLARAIEIHAALIIASEILDAYEMPDKSSVEISGKSGNGFGASEAPRGLLWHQYKVEDSLIKSARIISPTGQNQARIEEDIANTLLEFGLDKSEAEIQFEAERVIRNYDPCISCATHFLNLNLQRC